MEYRYGEVTRRMVELMMPPAITAEQVHRAIERWNIRLAGRNETRIALGLSPIPYGQAAPIPRKPEPRCRYCGRKEEARRDTCESCGAPY